MKTILTRRQEQISGLISCGMAKKEIANALKISAFTVDNTLRLVYTKTGLGKINELTGWWINNHYNLQINFHELKNQILLM
jgi:DNA-binding CsgD family transcriptional regulator